MRSPHPAVTHLLVPALAFGLWGAAPATAGDFCFQTTPYEVQQSPSHVMAGDLNGDGAADLVAANHDIDEDTISVLLNNGDGTFAGAMHYTVAGRPYWLGVNDLDGDLDVDVMVSNFYGHNLAVLLNDGTGALEAPVYYPTGFFPTFAILAHLDRDGDLDIAVNNSADSTLSVLMNNGDGTFAEQVTYGVGVNPYGVTAGDFNGDAINDLAVANYDVDADAISVLMNNGDGTFAPQVPYPVNDGPVGIANADLNADSYPDLVVAETGNLVMNNTVSVLFNDGFGGFGPAIPHVVGVGPYSVALDDLNGDSYPDIISANEGSGGSAGDISVLLNNGDGTFSAAQSYFGGNAPLAVAVSDLDGNTTPELAVAAYGDLNVFVLFNQYPAITQDPAGQQVSEGGSAIFTVGVSGPGPFSFQWRLNGVDLADGGSISGAGTDTLTISPVTGTELGLYDVIVTNECGSLVSAAAELTLASSCRPNPDINGSGSVDGADLGLLLAAWGSCSPEPGECCIADLNADNEVDGADLGILLSSWST
jgi:hypothetical protein